MKAVSLWTSGYLLLMVALLGYSKPAPKESKEVKGCKEAIGVQTGFLEDRDVKTSTAQKNFSVSDAWCPTQNNDKQFFAVDLGEDFLFTKVATQGKVDDKNRFMKSYGLQFSSDNKKWKPYISEGKEILDGNKDTFTVKYHKLEADTVGRYVKLIPKTWNSGICARMELYGCAVDELKKAQVKDQIKTPVQAPNLRDILPGATNTQVAKDVAIPGVKSSIPDVKSSIPDVKSSIPDLKSSIPDVKATIPEAKNTKGVPKRDSEANWNFAAAMASQENASEMQASDNADLLELTRQLGTPN